MTGIDPLQLRAYVVRPVLQFLDLHSPAAEDLLMGTAAVESGCGTYIVQVGGGPAQGIYQMEPATEKDIHSNYLAYRTSIADKVWSLRSTEDVLEEMVYNLGYATAMCRVHYLRVSEPLPVEDDVAGMASYWKRFFNSVLGKGTEQKFIEAWERYDLSNKG